MIAVPAIGFEFEMADSSKRGSFDILPQSVETVTFAPTVRFRH